MESDSSFSHAFWTFEEMEGRVESVVFSFSFDYVRTPLAGTVARERGVLNLNLAASVSAN